MNPAVIKDLLGSKREEPFYKRLNLFEIREGTVIGTDLQFSQGVELARLPDSLLMEQGEQEQYLLSLKRMLHSLPEGISLQFILRAREGDRETIETAKEAVLGGDDLSYFIGSQRIAHLSKKFTQRKRVFLFYTTYPKGATLKAARFSLKGFLLPSRNGHAAETLATEHERRLRELTEIEGTLRSALAQLGIEARKLDDRALAEFFFEHLNPRRSKDLPCPGFVLNGGNVEKAGLPTTRSLLILSGALSDFPGVELDGTHHRAVSLNMVPEDLDADSLPGFLLHLWPDLDLCVSIHIIANAAKISKLKRDGNISRALGSPATSGSKDYAAIQKHGEIDELLTVLQETTQKLFEVGFCVLIKGQSGEEADRKTRAALIAFRELGEAEGIVEDLSHLDCFLSLLPNHSKLMRRRHPIHSQPLCHLLPLSAPWKGVEE